LKDLLIVILFKKLKFKIITGKDPC